MAGLFGILSVYFDQSCYRLEKKCSDLLSEINEAVSLKEFCFSVNEHLLHIEDEITNLESLFIDFDHNKAVDLEGYYNDVKSETYEILNDLNKQKNFKHIKDDGFDELLYALRSRSTSYNEEYDSDSSLFDYTLYGSEESKISWHGSYTNLINTSYDKWESLLKKDKDLRETHNSLIYKRQTAIVASMISSLISIFLIIVFFKLISSMSSKTETSNNID
ncbi:MAG: hypothetical protein MK212_19845 [Saprospiraceae bacterium]|nr:hypothetical protein [Saprospiraceae bacterium]